MPNPTERHSPTATGSPSASQAVPPPGRVVGVVLAAALLPGAGHLLLGRRVAAALFLLIQAAGITLAVWHLGRGVELLETSLGTFGFAVMLRALAVLHLYSVLDTYLRVVDPAGEASPVLRRQAVLLNMLLPGTGYLLARDWIRSVTGLALLGLVLYFAHSQSHPYMDIVFVAMQLIMGVAVYRLMRMQELRAASRGEEQAPLPPRLSHVQAAQVVVLVVGTAAVAWFGWVVQQRLPNRTLLGLRADDLHVQRTEDALRLSVPSLGLTLSAMGPNWTSIARQGGFLFMARHPEGAELYLGIQPIPSFVRPRRFIERLRAGLVGQGFVHHKTTELKLGGIPAVQMRFSGQIARRAVDQWAVAVPRDGFVYLMIFNCLVQRCPHLAPALKRTRDSFRVSGQR